MNPDQARTAIAEALNAIAPDVEFDDLDLMRPAAPS